jgi:hypothetical protein
MLIRVRCRIRDKSSLRLNDAATHERDLTGSPALVEERPERAMEAQVRQTVPLRRLLLRKQSVRDSPAFCPLQLQVNLCCGNPSLDFCGRALGVIAIPRLGWHGNRQAQAASDEQTGRQSQQHLQVHRTPPER